MRRAVSRLLIRLVGAFGLFCLAACATAGLDTAVPRTVFHSVTVVPMDRPETLTSQDVVIFGGRIIAMGPTGSISLRPTDYVIDGRGRFLMPGLWDMHVHSTRPKEMAGLKGAMPLYLSYGIVGVRDMGATLDELATVKRDLVADPSLPDLVAAGPLLDGPKRRFQPDVALALNDVSAARRAVSDLARAGVDFLKPYDGLSPEQYRAIVDAAKPLYLSLAGHIPQSMTLDEVTALGQKSVEHTTLKLIEDCTPDGSKAMPTILRAWALEGLEAKYREINAWVARRDPAACDAMYRRVASRGAWFTPTLSLELDSRPWVSADDFADLSAATRKDCEEALIATGEGTEARREAVQNLLEIDRAMSRSGVPMLAGTDASNNCISHGRSLHTELRLLRELGLSNWEVLKTATLNPARFLGRSDEGLIQVGAKANLLLLDGDPLADLSNTLRIDGAMRAGHWRDKAELERLRRSALETKSAG